MSKIKNKTSRRDCLPDKLHRKCSRVFDKGMKSISECVNGSCVSTEKQGTSTNLVPEKRQKIIGQSCTRSEDKKIAVPASVMWLAMPMAHGCQVGPGLGVLTPDSCGKPHFPIAEDCHSLRISAVWLVQRHSETLGIRTHRRHGDTDAWVFFTGSLAKDSRVPRHGRRRKDTEGKCLVHVTCCFILTSRLRSQWYSKSLRFNSWKSVCRQTVKEHLKLKARGTAKYPTCSKDSAPGGHVHVNIMPHEAPSVCQATAGNMFQPVAAIEALRSQLVSRHAPHLRLQRLKITENEPRYCHTCTQHQPYHVQSV